MTVQIKYKINNSIKATSNLVLFVNEKFNIMKKADTLLLITAIIWVGITISVTISPENSLYLMIFGGFLSLGSVKKYGAS